ncbi:MAG: cobalt ECF transporter T component CbiQ [Candidatus Altiarchaeota archaeon]|nr:cobalt ECF transporter T component CbiQ [Candidatus Altiarchaeota archaeon]
MTKFPEIDKYAGIKSPLHNWDPRARLISILFLIYSINLIQDLGTALIGFLIAILLVTISKIPIPFILGYMKWVTLFVLSLLIILSLTVPGREVFSFYILSISAEGLYKGSLVSLRAFTSIMLVFPMIGTTRFDNTLKALEKLGIPNKFVQAIMFTYRYIFVLIDEFHRMTKSLKARGFKRGTNVYTMKTLGKAIGMLFVRSYERAENVYNAMISRGYTGTIRTLAEFRMCNMDWIKAFTVIGIAISLHGVSFIG